MRRTLPRRFASLLGLAGASLLVLSCALHGQDDPSLLPDSTSDTPALSPAISASPASRDVSLKLLPINFLQDQEKMWTFPGRLVKGQHWVPTIAVAAGTFAFLSNDPRVGPYFGHTRIFRSFDHVFDSRITGWETIAIPSSLYAIGLARRDSYMQKTALFAAEAVADSEVIRAVMNSATRRLRPADIPGAGTYENTFLHSRSLIGSSFPSGHTIAAVAVATVIARRYHRQRWVPIAAYGFAGVIGFSRISLRAHFPSDVFLGGALGYAIARYDVVRE